MHPAETVLFFLSALLMLALGGCMSLPSGTPPEGNIVKPAPASELLDNEEETVNHIITALSTECLPLANAAKPVPVTIEIKEVEPRWNRVINKLCFELVKMKLVQPVPRDAAERDYFLVFEIKELPVSGQKEKLVAFISTLLPPDRQKKLWEKTVYLKTGTGQ